MAFVEDPPEIWTIDAQEVEFRAIIEAGLQGRQAHRELALQLVNQLAAKGQLQYRSYIEEQEPPG